MPHGLTAFAGVASLEVRRDGEFSVTGKLSTPLDGLLVPITGARWVEQANANPRVVAVVTTAALAGGVDQRMAVGAAPFLSLAPNADPYRFGTRAPRELR